MKIPSHSIMKEVGKLLNESGEGKGFIARGQ